MKPRRIDVVRAGENTPALVRVQVEVFAYKFAEPDQETMMVDP